MAEITFRDATRRYNWRYWPLIALYVVLCLAGKFLIRALGTPPDPLVVVGVAALTAAPMAGVFWALGRFLKETDEYMRQIHTQAMLTAGGITLSLTFVLGFILVYRAFPGLEDFPAMLMVGPVFFIFWGLSFMVQCIRHARARG
jgi:hypothetical protein